MSVDSEEKEDGKIKRKQEKKEKLFTEGVSCRNCYKTLAMVPSKNHCYFFQLLHYMVLGILVIKAIIGIQHNM